MTNFRHGEIYFIECDPSCGHEFQKIRPAVIISSNDLLMRSNLVTCVTFTKNKANWIEKDDVFVKRDSKNHLLNDSILKTQHLSTFDKRRVKKYIGILDFSL